MTMSATHEQGSADSKRRNRGNSMTAVMQLDIQPLKIQRFVDLFFHFVVLLILDLSSPSQGHATITIRNRSPRIDGSL